MNCCCQELLGMFIGLLVFFLFHEPIIKSLEYLVDKIRK